ncbi:hypothetical protein GCK32_014589, partial [Trichostrongylus colubriformis]
SGDSFDNYLTPDEWWQTRVIQPCFVWSVNIFVVICVLTRLLVYGEPVQDFKSRSWRVFLSLRSRAREEAAVGNVREAQRQYIECLQILERPLPSAGVEQALSVVWQIIRHALNGLWIGRWFSRRKRDAGKPVTVVCKSHAHTAMIYHKMHQLHLLGVDESNEGISGLYLALSAVNLAESAGASTDGLPRNVLADIYIAAAIRTRLCLPPFLASIFSPYFYKRARRHVRRADEDTLAAYQLTSRMLNGANPLHTWTAVCRIRKQRFDAVSGRVTYTRAQEPDPFHLHVLCKLHDDIPRMCERVK